MKMLDDMMADFGKYILNNPIRHLYAGIGAVEGIAIEGISQISQAQMDFNNLCFMTLGGAAVGYGVGALMDIGKYVSEEIFERNFKYLL